MYYDETIMEETEPSSSSSTQQQQQLSSSSSSSSANAQDEDDNDNDRKQPLWDITEHKPQFFTTVASLHSLIWLLILLQRRKTSLSPSLWATAGSVFSLAIACWLYWYRTRNRQAVIQEWGSWKHVVKQQATEIRGTVSSGFSRGKSTLSSGLKSAQNYLSGSRQRIEYTFHEQFHDMISRAVDLASVFIKKSVIDKDMPELLQHLLRDSVDAILPDLKQRMFHRAQSWFSPSRHLGFLGGMASPVTATHRKFGYPANATLIPTGRRNWSAAYRLAERAKALAVTGTPVINAQPPLTEESPKTQLETSKQRCSSYDVRRCGRLIIYYYDKIRAHILYGIHPYDKSSWACMKSRRWCLLTAIGMIPGFIGQLWWLLLFIMKDKSDEYQLANFIVSFESAKFFSVGVWSFVQGAVRLFLCVHVWRQDTDGISMDTCEEYGAKLTWDNVAFFILQLTLVWSCFLLLPLSRRRYRHAVQARPKAERELEQKQTMDSQQRHTSEQNQSGSNCNRYTMSKWLYSMYEYIPLTGKKDKTTKIPDDALKKYSRGGYLTSMYRYFVGIVLGTIASGALTLYFMNDQPQWQLLGSLFWVRVIYGLLSFPFVLFKLPLAMQLFVCSTPTAYDQKGQTVLRHGNAEYPATNPSLDELKGTGSPAPIPSHRVKRQLFSQ